jgi:hypothetical protein
LTTTAVLRLLTAFAHRNIANQHRTAALLAPLLDALLPRVQSRDGTLSRDHSHHHDDDDNSVEDDDEREARRLLSIALARLLINVYRYYCCFCNCSLFDLF